MSRVSKSELIEQLREIGIEKGDTLFVAADLMRVGYFNESPDQTLKDWVAIFDTLLGNEGTIVVPTYSPSFIRFFQKYDFVFTRDSMSNSGSLAKAFISFAPGSIRGHHPTNSCTSRGLHAKFIADNDRPDLPKYTPYQKVVELGGKNLMLGILDERNSPFTYHYVQEKLGHTRSHPYCGLLETSYIDENGKKKKYIVREVGGCTGGVHKAWGYLLASQAVTINQIGKTMSALVDAKKSAEILEKVMTENPHLIKCDNKACLSCYGRFRYNGFGVIRFYFLQIPQLISKGYQKLFS